MSRCPSELGVVELGDVDDVLFDAGAASVVAAKKNNTGATQSQRLPVRTGHSVPSRRVETSKPRTPNRSAPLRKRRGRETRAEREGAPCQA